MRTADFDYHLPAELIAQQARPRGTSRMLVLDRRADRLRFSDVRALPACLRPGDVLLRNDVRVIPARIRARRPGGGSAELMLVRPTADDTWEVLARPAKRLRAGIALTLRCGAAVPVERVGEGRWLVAFDPPLDAAHLEEVGEVPLPPYIRREHGPEESDRGRYQTVYARQGRAVAAPTAGLHFTPELLESVSARGVSTVSVTLHVGPGTFQPVKAEDPRDHRLDPEDYEIPESTAREINGALAAGRRVVCVGTTSCRALEHALSVGHGRLASGAGRAEAYIVPGYRFLGTGALLTNFHLPRSTLLMLVSAWAGRERVLAAYREAVAAGLHFYSFGDAMLAL
ncbi:MAG: tRNA preQ1(34) S-adenosylmethionine ribosyltransferase-isomerase QueA [Acidobacteriota bacterium]